MMKRERGGQREVLYKFEVNAFRELTQQALVLRVVLEQFHVGAGELRFSVGVTLDAEADVRNRGPFRAAGGWLLSFRSDDHGAGNTHQCERSGAGWPRTQEIDRNLVLG